MILHTSEGKLQLQFPFIFTNHSTIESKGGKEMYTVMVVGIVIVIIVLLLAVITTSKAYSYKHTVDPLENNPHIDNEENIQQEQKKS